MGNCTLQGCIPQSNLKPHEQTNRQQAILPWHKKTNTLIYIGIGIVALLLFIYVFKRIQYHRSDDIRKYIYKHDEAF